MISLCVWLALANAPASVSWNVPAPAWAEPLPVPDAAKAATLAKTQSMLVLLSDEQVSTRGDKHVYVHRAEQALQPIGLELVSELHVTYDPSYERLLIHRARVLRGGRTVFSAGPRDMRIAAADDSLVDRQFTSEVQATIVLKSVRVGDVVDTEYSVVGDNPVFAKKPAGRLQFYRLPTLFTRARIIGRPGQLLVSWYDLEHPEVVRTLQDERWTYVERRELSHALPPNAEEDLTPAWIETWPRMDFSAYHTWAEVVRWAEPLYPLQQPLTRVKELAEWQKLPKDEDKLLAALRFVQNEVRYLGYELGPHSHKPHAPRRVLEERLGDCKDKTYLLIVLLRALGIDAAPALVNTGLGRGLDDVLPSPLAFNHVIVLATLPDGSEHFVDPTWTHQRGTLATMTSVDYERALVVRPNETELREIPRRQPDEALVELHERFVVPSFIGWPPPGGALVPPEAAAELFTRAIYRGARADEMRSYFASEQPEDVARELEETTAEEFEGAALAEPYKIEDDPDRNVVEATAHLHLPQFWVDNRRELSAHALADVWPKKLSKTKRKTPFQIDAPVHVLHDIEVDLPGPWTLPDLNARVDNPFFLYQRATRVDGTKVSMQYRLKTKVDHGAPTEAEAYNRAVAALDGLYSIELFHEGQTGDGEASNAGDGRLYYGALALVVVGYFGLGVARRRSKRRSADRRHVHRPGDAPESALPASAATNVAALLARRTCQCGKKLAPNESLRIEGIRLGERRLRTIELACAGCGKMNVVYVEAEAVAVT